MHDTPRVVVPLAEGFEEVEAVAVIDVLRRAGIEVICASVSGSRMVTGSHRLSVAVDTALAEVHSADLDLVALPGGLPGSTTLAASPAVLELLRRVYGQGGLVAAICAAPLALQAAGLLHGRKVTCYPGIEKQLMGAIYTGQTVECDERIITSRGAGTALPFALELVRALGRAAQAEQLRTGMLIGA